MSESLFNNLKRSSATTPSLGAIVASDLGKRIVSSQLKPGAVVEDEEALASRYRVSRSVVRDAIKLLAGKGLVDVRRGAGTRVRPRSDWSVFDSDVLAWQQSAPPDPAQLRQLSELRQIIEPRAARWAAERGTEQQHAAILDALRDMEARADVANDFVMADALFHRAILHAAGNDLLVALEGPIFAALLGSISLTNDDRLRNLVSLPFHRKVYEAIVARDGARAQRCMVHLLREADEQMNRHLRQNAQ